MLLRREIVTRGQGLLEITADVQDAVAESGCRVVVPLWVLEELDKLKTYSDEKGRNARESIRFLDGLAKKGDILAKLAAGSP